MPRTLKQHWLLILAVALLVVGAGGAWWFHSAQRAAFAQVAAPEAETAIVASLARQALTYLNLDSEQLVAMNLTAAQAAALREVVVTWCRDHKSALRTALATAEPQREAALTTALADLRQSISASLDAAQRSAWQKLCQYPDLPVPYRLIGPSGEQRKQLHQLLEQRAYRLMAAKTPADRDAVEAKFQQELGRVLTGDQQAILAAYHQNSPAASAAISTAMAPLNVRPGI